MSVSRVIIIILRLLLAVVAVYVGWRLRYVLFMLLGAALLAYPVEWISRVLSRFRPRKIPTRWWRAAVTLLSFVGIGYGIYGAFTLLARPFAQEYQSFTDSWPVYREHLLTALERWQTWYTTLPGDLRQTIETSDMRAAMGAASRVMSGLLVGTWTTLTHIVEVIILPVVAFYFLTDGRSLRRDLVSLTPRRWWREVLWFLREAHLVFENYLVGQIILCLIAGVVVGVGLSLLGVRYAVILGVLAGITRAIPVIGPVIGAIPIVGLAALQFPDNLTVAVHVLVFFTVLHFAESKFILPLLLGERLKLHPVVVIIALLAGAQFGGLVGMFLAAPVAAMLRLLIRRYWIRRQCAPKTEVACANL